MDDHGATLLRAGQPRQNGLIQGAVSKSALLALTVGIVLTALLCAQVYRLETENDNTAFARRAELRVRIFNQSVQESVAGLSSIHQLFAISSTPISREQFREMTLPLLAQHPYVRSFVFHRYVTGPERPAYEAAMRRTTPGFTIKQVQEGRLVPSTGTGPWMVVEYYEPLAGNEVVLGYDLLSDPVHALAIRRAMDTGLVSASGLRSFQVLQGTTGKALTIRLPVYRRGAPLHDLGARRRAFIGDTTAVFDAYRFARQVFERAGLLDMPGIHINVYAAASPVEAALVFRHGAAPSPAPSVSPLVSRLLGPAAVVRASHTVDIAGKPWHLVISRDPSSAIEAHARTLLVLAAGIFLTLLSTAYLKAAASRSRIIERTVEKRTAELQARTSELQLTMSELQLRNRAIEAISLENATLYRDLQEENSERKRAEEALLERSACIRRLVESNIIGIYFWDLAGNISDANDAMLQITGYSRTELVEGKIKWTNITPPEYYAADELAKAELRQGGTCSPYEKEFIRKDGRRIPVLIGAALLEGAQGNGVAFVLDLTERKRAEAEREARQTADAANQAKSQFLANMSHELRTPLNAILGYAQILQRDKSCIGRRASGLNTIYQSGEHLLTLINDVLDLSKIEAGKFELSPSAFNLASFLQVIGDIIRIRAEQKSLGFRLDALAPLPAAVRADEKRLRQVLLNLLGNAVKFTDRGEVVLRVQQLWRSATQVRLHFEVTDTGIGIAPDQREAIFRRFEQVGEVQRRFGGTGLGLTISRQLIHMMDGELEVESEVGRGSCFQFALTLPLEAELAVPAASGTVNGYLGRRRRLLIADDVLPNRAMLADLLSPLGFSIEEAADGQAALILAQAMRPDLIIMDMVMPVMDGLEAMRQLRQHAAFQATPIIAVSASASEQEQARSVAAGANVFLAKPIEPDRLLQQIGELLGLTWAYEQAEAEAKSAEPLVAPPRAELEALHALALAGNMRDILRWAEQLALLGETFHPFADKVRRLAEGYQSKTILALAEQHMNMLTHMLPSSTPSAVDAVPSDGKHEAHE